MKIDDVRSKTDADLEFDLKNIERELFDLRLKSSTESLQNPASIRQLRRQIARIRTILHERNSGVRGQQPVS